MTCSKSKFDIQDCKLRDSYSRGRQSHPRMKINVKLLVLLGMSMVVVCELLRSSRVTVSQLYSQEGLRRESVLAVDGSLGLGLGQAQEQRIWRNGNQTRIGVPGRRQGDSYSRTSDEVTYPSDKEEKAISERESVTTPVHAPGDRIEHAISHLIDHIYIITQPGEKDRHDAVHRYMKWLGIPESKYSLWFGYEHKYWETPAMTDRLQEDFGEYVSPQRVVGDLARPGVHLPRQWPMSEVEVCVSLSHYSIYAEMLRSAHKKVMIFEDDFCPSRFTAEDSLTGLLSEVDKHGWDALILGDCYRKGSHKPEWTSTQTSSGNRLVHETFATHSDFEEHLTFNCLHAYAISDLVATEVLRTRAFPVEFPVDVVVPQYLLATLPKSTYAFSQHLFNQAAQFPSGVQLDSGRYFELCRQEQNQTKYGGCVDTQLPVDFSIQTIHHKEELQSRYSLCLDTYHQLYGYSEDT